MLQKIILTSHEDWLQNRGRIGGSDAASIVGCNPYRTNVELWKIKTGKLEAEDISDKPYVKYGTCAEQYLRELFKLDYPEYEVFYEENNMFVNNKYPFAHASLDGWLRDEKGRMGIWECKTTNILNSAQTQKWKDRIPDNYYIQVLHYLMVTEFDFVVLKAQLKFDYGEDVYLQTKHYKIEREDVQADIDYLIQEEKKFWEYVVNDKQPNLILPTI